MGKMSGGFLGPFRGKLGTVVGAIWNGINYVRSKPTTSKKRSTLQLRQQARHAISMPFIQSMKQLVQVSFKTKANGKSAFNCAMSYTMKNAVTGEFPHLEIAYSKAKISEGPLPNAEQPAATPGNSTQVIFTWINNSEVHLASDDDKTIMVAYCPELKQFIYDFGATRKQQTDSLNVAPFAGKTVHTWLGFISKNQKYIADSVYLGEMKIGERVK